jgi:hypothetical protein
VELIGLFLIAAGLLVVAGVAKAARPDDTARAMTALLPGTPPLLPMRWLVRAGALAEAALGLVAIAFPRPITAALVACSYVGFAGVVTIARWRGGPLATCGCFGRPDTPPTVLHLVFDLVLAAAALAVAVTASGSSVLASVLSHMPWAGIPLLFASAVGLWLSVLALSALAALTAARHPGHQARHGSPKPAAAP